MRELAEIVRLRSGECRQVARLLPQLAAGELEGAEDQAPAEHVAHCVRCQAEVAAYRRIGRQLRALRGDILEPPAGAIAAVLAALEAAAAEQQAAGATWVVRAAYVGGITMATAAVGAAGVLVWMSRRRVGLPAAS